MVSGTVMSSKSTPISRALIVLKNKKIKMFNSCSSNEIFKIHELRYLCDYLGMQRATDKRKSRVDKKYTIGGNLCFKIISTSFGNRMFLGHTSVGS